MPRRPPARAEHGGFCLDEQHDTPALPAQSAEDADLAGALKDRHGHGVGDAEDAHQQGDGGCAPGDGMGQSDELIVGCAFGGGNGVQTGQSIFNFRLGALQIVLLRFAGGRGAKPHVKCRNLALQAGELLQLHRAA